MNNHRVILIPAGVYFMVSSTFALLGRHYGVRWMYDWGDGIGMAYTSALNFFLLGVVLYLLGRLEHKETNHD